jgi:fructan beta-fructosidase
MKKKLMFLFLCMLSFALVASGCTKKSNYYTEKYRPQYHFTPPSNWMNDPNGMVYYNGQYHLFYQYNPNGNDWGSMSWGHAVSTDMVTWTHEPVALKPDKLGMIFSGSAVVDSKNTSGLFNGGSGIVALYTSNSSTGVQQQCMAYSKDGIHFTKYKGNPVISNNTIGAFRDPKVFWYAQSKKWIMVVTCGNAVQFYDSTDLKKWNYLSRFGDNDGSHDGVWECPDLEQLPVDGNVKNKKWVLKVDVQDNAVGGGSGAQYFVGSFDGNKFVNANTPSTTLWVDYGTDFYAAQTWSNATDKDGSHYWLGWMSNWKYAGLVPTTIWRGEDTIPRKISLKTFSDGIRLVQSPVSQLNSLRDDATTYKNVEVKPNKNILNNFSGGSYEIDAEFELGTAKKFGFELRKSGSQQTSVFYDTEQSKIFVDRTHAGNMFFSTLLPTVSSGELKPVKNKIKMHIFVDNSSVEVFGNDGELVITSLIFPDPTSNGLELFSQGGNVKITNMQIYKLNSSWKQ